MYLICQFPKKHEYLKIQLKGRRYEKCFKDYFKYIKKDKPTNTNSKFSEKRQILNILKNTTQYQFFLKKVKVYNDKKKYKYLCILKILSNRYTPREKKDNKYTKLNQCIECMHCKVKFLIL